jgi:hypothetical protein
MNSYDIDGVIYLGEGRKGLLPRPEDVIISGRSWDEYGTTQDQFTKLGVPVECVIYLAPWNITYKTRRLSGLHKANTLNMLIGMMNKDIQIHFEDDPVQADIIRQFVPGIEVVMITHNLTEK